MENFKEKLLHLKQNIDNIIDRLISLCNRENYF